MQKLINLKLCKDSNIINLKLPKNTLIKVINAQKIKKAKKVKVNDVLCNSWSVLSVKTIDNFGKKIVVENNNIICTDSLKDFCKEMDNIFPNSAWDLKNIKAKKLCEVYNIKSIKKLFVGLKIENVFEDCYYSSGALMLQDNFYLDVQKVNISTFKQFKLV